MVVDNEKTLLKEKTLFTEIRTFWQAYETCYIMTSKKRKRAKHIMIKYLVYLLSQN